MRRTPNQTDGDVTCSRWCDQGKVTKRALKYNKVWKKWVFLRTPTHLFFFVSFYIRVFCGFWRKGGFCSIKITQNRILNCFYWIMQHHHFQNYTIITCYTYYGIQIRGRNVPNLCFCEVLLVNWLQSGKAWQVRAQQTEKNHSHTNSAVTRQIYVDSLLVQHLYHEFPTFLWPRTPLTFRQMSMSEMIAE